MRRRWQRYTPPAAVLIGALYLAFVAWGFRQNESPQVRKLGAVPVMDGGRIKPFDSVARSALMLISDRQVAKDPAGEKRSAMTWLLDMMSVRPAASQYPVIRIHNDQLLAILGLMPRSGFRYSAAELSGRFEEISARARQAVSVPAEHRTIVQRKVLELTDRLEIYAELLAGQRPRAVPADRPGEAWRPLSDVVKQYVTRNGSDEQAIDAMNAADQPALHLASALGAWQRGEQDVFARSVDQWAEHISTTHSEAARRAAFEAWFNRFDPSYQSMILYVIVGLLVSLAWLMGDDAWRRAAFGLAVLTFLVHSGGLAARMYLQGRPPVTNLYSSAVFAGWGCVLLALVLEWIYRNGAALIVAAVTGFVTLLVAHNLVEGDTLHVMRAVLDSNFWLATHVVTVSLGYSAGFIAGTLGIVYIGRGFFTGTLDRAGAESLGRMIYGVVCFALLLSFIGTVTGGIWADQSWGRFWGWDPKENGALMIVLWHALVMHARWGGLVAERGMAVLAVFGNVVTAWSWFGVNLLGVGLHAYGFMESGRFWLLMFVAGQLAIMGVGVLPRRFWMSDPNGEPGVPASDDAQTAAPAKPAGEQS
jgi:ABC-type transport system involved in cytochrome c biogenesis permease subunit